MPSQYQRPPLERRALVARIKAGLARHHGAQPQCPDDAALLCVAAREPHLTVAEFFALADLAYRASRAPSRWFQ